MASDCECEQFKRQNLSKDFSVFEYDGSGGWFERKQITAQFRADARKMLDALWLDAKKEWVKWLVKCEKDLPCAVKADDNTPPWTIKTAYLTFLIDYAESANNFTSRFRIQGTFEVASRKLKGVCLKKWPIRYSFTEIPTPVRESAPASRPKRRK